MLSVEQAFEHIGSDSGLTEDEIIALVEALTLVAQIAVDRVLCDDEPDGGDPCGRLST